MHRGATSQRRKAGRSVFAGERPTMKSREADIRTPLTSILQANCQLPRGQKVNACTACGHHGCAQGGHRAFAACQNSPGLTSDAGNGSFAIAGRAKSERGLPPPPPTIFALRKISWPEQMCCASGHRDFARRKRGQLHVANRPTQRRAVSKNSRRASHC